MPAEGEGAETAGTGPLEELRIEAAEESDIEAAQDPAIGPDGQPAFESAGEPGIDNGQLPEIDAGQEPPEAAGEPQPEPQMQPETVPGGEAALSHPDEAAAESPVAAAQEPHIEAVSDAVSALEGELCVASTRAEFDALFRRGQELGRRVSADTDLGPQERAAVESHLRDILHSARVDYDSQRATATDSLRAARERLSLSAESLAEARSVQDVQEVRADLRLIREGLQAASAWAQRDEQAQAWSLWQSTNQAAWSRLNELWGENETSLRSLLDRAQSEVERGNPRGAKDAIKSFHSTAKTHECSHEAMKTMRGRAQQLWDDATRAAEQKHEAYLLVARRRLDHLRSLLGRSQQTLARAEEDLRQLQEQLGRAPTDVAAALIRGQIDQRQRDLRRFAAEGEVLARRIADTERSLS